jgi:two-component system, NarL family, response regulator NreC
VWLKVVERKSNLGSSKVRTILIADDHRIMREALRSLLEKSGNFECVAEADDGYQAVKLAMELRPDIIIMDIAMPNLDGIEATRQIKSELPEVEVVVLSIHATRNYVLQALQAGASAYLLKDSDFEELSTALLSISGGGIYLSPAITKTGALASLKVGPSGDVAGQAGHLTKRELQVLQLIAEGKSTKDIAARLGLSAKTVETYRIQIMNKVNLYTIPELTKYAIREGITLL